MNFPRVLVFSNNSFSKSSANGRTLGNFFAGWPKSCLAQFCLMTSGPDFDLCDNYYCISDKSALKAFLTFKIPQRTFFDEVQQKNDPPISFEKPPKTPFRMLLRNVVWSLCKWKRGPLIQWVEAFSPEVIVLMSGDSYFFLNMARYFANMFHIPLVLINTEGYYLFERNYMWSGEGDKLFFPLYKYIYRHYFIKLMNDVKYTIYANSLLKRDYDAVFPGESSVIYTGSTIEFKIKNELNTPPIFSYLGNFGYRRYETLIELSELLHEINPAYRLNVYGDAAPNVVDVFNKAPYLDYKGLVPYNKVIEVMHQSDILFHVENQAEDLQMSLKYGFTTKIADSISSGTLFCLYASSEIACSRYIIDNKAAIFADIRENLKQELIKVLTDDNYRNTIIKTGYEVACHNHDLKDNADRFKHIIEKVIEENKW